MPETAQPTAETAEKKSRGLGSYVVWAFVGIIVYFLSAGPVHMILNQKTIRGFADEALGYLYAPWRFVYFRSPLHRPIGMYMHMWSPDIFDKKGHTSGCPEYESPYR